MAQVGKSWQEHAAAGQVLEGHSSQPASTATTVRINPQTGKALVTDGPFIDARERIGGYAIIDVPGLDQAIEQAKSWPAGRRSRDQAGRR